MKRRRTRSHRLVLALAIIVAAAATYVVLGAMVHVTRSSHLGMIDAMVSRGAEVFVVLWCMWVGTSIGSFLNVVAWRMPRGLGINGRSMCPRCRVQLRARDNFPVLGWIALGGRCRTCRLPISVRYPIVEFAVGVTVTLVAVGEFHQRILPFSDATWQRGWQGAFPFDSATVVMVVYHTVALSLCWAVGLIRVDGNRLPSKLIGFAAIALIVPMLVDPQLMVVPWQVDVPDSWRPAGRYVDAILRCITALVTAILMARSMSRSLCPNADPKLDPLGSGTQRLMDLIVILAIPTIVVGWQAAIAVVVLACLIAIATRGIRVDVDHLGRLAISMPIAMTLQIVGWDLSQRLPLWPSEGSRPAVFLAWAAAVMVIPLWMRERPTEPERISEPERNSEPASPGDSVPPGDSV